MQDNTKRGERTLFWLKVLFVLFIFLFFANNAFGESMKSMRQESVGLGVAYIAYGFVCGFGFLISSVMFLVYYFSWLHRAIANLRILTKPDFSPIGAIVLTLIPVIGFVLHFWIFNDMVGCQEKCMEERGILKGRFPKKLLVAWFFATLAVVDAGLATMTVGAFNNMGTIDLTGTALTEATLNLGSGVTAATTGTILYPATFQKFVVSPADQTMRSLEDFSTLPTLPEGATYYVTLAETREEFGKGSMTVTNCAAGVNVRVARPNGTSIDVVPIDGTVALTETPQIAGAATAFDATYTNTVAYAYRAPGWNAGSGQDVKPPTYNNTDNDETTGMYILHHPWVMQNITSLGDFTLVVVGTMSPSRSTQFIHIGSTGSGLMGLLITTTENEDEVLIAKNTAATVDAENGVKASVPNAATARHAYVINKKGTVFEVWVDGVKRGQFDAGDGFALGSSSSCGVQIGSDIGGAIFDVTLTVPRGTSIGDECAWENLLVKFNIPIYSNLGNYVNRFKQSFNVNPKQYLNSNNQVVFAIEWANKAPSGIRTHEDRAVGTGAYIYKAEIEAKFSPNTSNPEIKNNQKLVQNFSTKTSFEQKKTFGIKRTK